MREDRDSVLLNDISLVQIRILHNKSVQYRIKGPDSNESFGKNKTGPTSQMSDMTLS